MCGRFARYQPLSAWLEPLGVMPQPDLFARDDGETDRPRYNIPPGTRTWIATLDDQGAPAIAEKLWSFPTSRGNRINVRSETAHRVPEYRPHFDQHRCVVFASGFYEPKGPKSVKQRPWYFFRARDSRPLFFAGIAKAEGFSILTGAPAAPVAAVHDRSPIMVPADKVLAWLDPDRSGEAALSQFTPAAVGETLESWHVSDAAKNPRNEGPELISVTGRD